VRKLLGGDFDFFPAGRIVFPTEAFSTISLTFLTFAPPRGRPTQRSSRIFCSCAVLARDWPDQIRTLFLDRDDRSRPGVYHLQPFLCLSLHCLARLISSTSRVPTNYTNTYCTGTLPPVPPTPLYSHHTCTYPTHTNPMATIPTLPTSTLNTPHTWSNATTITPSSPTPPSYHPHTLTLHPPPGPIP
jgi:hypothetical protein